jgi:hypothetical protein
MTLPAPRHVQQWRHEQDALFAKLSQGVPKRVVEFVAAVAEKVGTLERRGVTRTVMTGRELKLTGWKQAGQLAAERRLLSGAAHT